MIELIENDFLRIEVNALGAELRSVYDKLRDQEILWQANPAFWPRRSPVLFPIVGKLKNNAYRAEGKRWELSQHGFARDTIFNLLEKKPDSLCYSMKNNADSLKVYPYRFELKIKYTLKEKCLSVRYEVINLDDKNIYFSIGGHPGFNCPLNNGEKLTDYFLEFETEELADKLLLDGAHFNGKTQSFLKNEKTISLNEELFLEEAIVFKDLKSNFVKLKNKKLDYELKFNFKGFPYLAIWKKTRASFLCLEPWFGLADYTTFDGALEEKEGIVSLSDGEKFVCAWSVELK